MSTYNLLNGYVGSKTPYISKIKALFDDSCTKYIEIILQRLIQGYEKLKGTPLQGMLAFAG